MNDSELESKLKNVPLPQRSEEYWEHFPAEMRRQLPRHPATNPNQTTGWPHLVLSLGVRFACGLVILLALGQPLKAASGVIFKNEKMIRQELAQLPYHLRVLMADEHGLHDLVADKE